MTSAAVTDGISAAEDKQQNPPNGHVVTPLAATKDTEWAEEREEARPLVLPEALRNDFVLMKNFHQEEGLPYDEIVSVVFIVRIIDAMHSVFVATSICESFAEALKKKLGVELLDVELEVNTVRWNWRRGKVLTSHRISVDLDAAGMHTFSKIAASVLDGKITPMDGLLQVYAFETRSKTKLECCYEDFPGRIGVLALLSLSGCVVFFQGTWVDLGFSAFTGLVAGIIHAIASRNPSISRIQEILISTVVAMLAAMAVTLLPDATCFSAIVLGTLFWFLYGTAFFVSLYEISNGHLLTGVTRLAQAVVNSYYLAFGASFGLWIAFYMGEDRFDTAQKACPQVATEYRIDPHWFCLFMPLAGLGALMQLKVPARYWIPGLIVQIVGYGTQYCLEKVWGQPSYIGNIIPAYLITITAHALVRFGMRFTISDLKVTRHAYVQCASTEGEETPSGAVFNISNREIKFEKDFGWSHGHAGSYEMGFVRPDAKMQFERSDLWFLFLPAIYLLVPGSSLLWDAFSSIFSLDVSQNAQSMIGVVVIGLSQAFGVRLALATLELVSTLLSKEKHF